VATLADVELAGQLLSETMGQSVESLLPETRHFLEQLDAYVARRAEEEHRHRMQVRFKQRELREALGISDFSLRKHLARLVELEYVLAYRTGRGNERQYELLYEGAPSKPFSLGLITTKELAEGNYDG
jgi:DNA-binding transcriptional ArsR family regulator